MYSRFFLSIARSQHRMPVFAVIQTNRSYSSESPNEKSRGMVFLGLYDITENEMTQTIDARHRENLVSKRYIVVWDDEVRWGLVRFLVIYCNNSTSWKLLSRITTMDMYACLYTDKNRIILKDIITAISCDFSVISVACYDLYLAGISEVKCQPFPAGKYRRKRLRCFVVKGTRIFNK